MTSSPSIAPRIMIVDDAPANLLCLQDMLRGIGCEVMALPDGAMALLAAAKRPPDLILLDVMMPGLDGHQVCSRLKNDPQLQDIPVIFLSALSDSEDKVRGLKAGAVDFITKPFQFEEVQARVEAHLGLRRLRLELVAKNEALTKTNAALREMETLRDSLMHMIVHDLRNPLQTASAALGFAKKAAEAQNDERLLRMIRHGQTAVGTINEMAGAVLDLHKMETGNLELHRAIFDFRTTVQEVLAPFELQTPGKTLSATLPDTSLQVHADAGMVRRILQNLVANAFKFTADTGGIVEISTEALADQVRVSVRDNGPGIAVQFRDKVFDKFWQGEAYRHQASSSCGLGLAFCKMAVEAHGGKIGISGKVGEGSVFWFTLPVPG